MILTRIEELANADDGGSIDPAPTSGVIAAAIPSLVPGLPVIVPPREEDHDVS
jgi:hypothetical protein